MADEVSVAALRIRVIVIALIALLLFPLPALSLPVLQVYLQLTAVIIQIEEVVAVAEGAPAAEDCP